jgi:osmotically-inducible protein OsmY
MAAVLAVTVSAAAMVTVGCAGSPTSRSTGTYIDDTAVSTKVKTELLADKNVKSTEVDVKTYGGEVQLSGFVDDAAQKERAVEIARAVPGVRNVRDDLVIKTPSATAQGNPTMQEPAGAEAPATNSISR